MTARKRDIFSLIEYEAKRDSALSELVQRAPRMTDEEIDAAQVRLPWMRRALRAIRARDASHAIEAAILRNAMLGYTGDPTGEIRQWNAGNAFIGIGRGHLEIKCGDLVWFDGGAVWIDTIYTQHVDPSLLQNTTSLGKATRSEYMRAVRERLLRNAPTEFTPRDSWSSVRFYRP